MSDLPHIRNSIYYVSVSIRTSHELTVWLATNCTLGHSIFLQLVLYKVLRINLE